MAYLGNTPTTQSFISGTDYFNGDGSTTAFTLTRRVNSVNDVEAVINNVVQQPNTAYNISGTTITFTSAPSAGTGNIYVRYLSTTTQSVTPSQNTVSWNTLDTNTQNDLGISFKNRIINGGMVIDQRNAGASITPTANTFSADRWSALIGSVASKMSFQQTSTAPAGFTNSIVMTTVSAYSPSGSEYFGIQQPIEGYNVADFGFGTANAKTFTLSFWVRSSITGTFGGSFSNNAYNRSYPFTYTISSGNTWEKKSITVAGDSTGTWTTDNSAGLRVYFSFGAGSSYLGTPNAWASGFYFSGTGATNVVSTAGATLYITGVQLELGTQATAFDYRDFNRELLMCQRYAASTFPIGTAWGQNKGAAGCVIVTAVGAGVGYGLQVPWRFPVNMRTTPGTITTYNPVAANANARNFGASADRSISALGFAQNSQSGIVYTADATGDTVGQAVGVHYSVDAEL